MLSVCAVILDYFGVNKTIACLNSLLGQGLDSVIVVDNSGDDDENTKLKEALSVFGSKKPSFVIHQMVNSCNLGFAAGVNKALRWLEDNHPHSYYLLINNDASASPGMLPELIKSIQKNEKTALAAPIINIGKRNISYWWYHRLSGHITFRKIFGSFKYLTGCCLLVDRRIIHEGLFDEDFFMYGEDIDLCWRLQISGWDTKCVSQAMVMHEGTGSSKIGGFFYEYHMARCHILLARKLARYRWELPFLYASRLLMLLARAIVRAVRFRTIIPIKANLKALKKTKVFDFLSSDYKKV